ncbi:glutaminyl-peptide cyclotransferase [Mycobacterium sp. 852013-51886_SCH5428379]|nr:MULTISPECIES: glutaminyl-peptide cyclotransferase [Mycobacteriaceae]MCK0173954.1 glutaminyl-peptide cyclotransferase [Mycolicibacterium sp. F2034L]OBB56783.1 glutaminyl-peptide cyclotransferase [Mycobacterium sp. 852013-51886_SCH5428379]
MSAMRNLRGFAALSAAALTALTVLAGCAGEEDTSAPEARPEVERLRLAVMGEEPHDPAAFTQGFEMAGPALYETTGIVDESQLRELDPATGAVRRSVPLPGPYFGEGMTVVGDRIWQVTWRDGVAIEWDIATFTPKREVAFEGEGWGVCNDGARIIHSDGTDQLRFYDPADYNQIGSVSVTDANGYPVKGLNELECVDGQVWANVFPTDEIVRIDPESGAMTASVDGSVLRRGQPARNVLNGIAHVEGNEFLMTGKNWPTTYRVRLEPAG